MYISGRFICSEVLQLSCFHYFALMLLLYYCVFVIDYYRCLNVLCFGYLLLLIQMLSLVHELLFAF